MAIALLSLPHLFQPVQALLGWLAPRPAPGLRVPARTAAPQAAAAAAPAKPLRVLRVLRVLEPATPRSSAGRMVISGRLADVCAELDRLAALEAHRHSREGANPGLPH